MRIKRWIANKLVQLACRIDAGTLFVVDWKIGGVLYHMHDWAHDREISYESREYKIADQIIQEWATDLRIAHELCQQLQARPISQVEPMDHKQLKASMVNALEAAINWEYKY